MSRSQLLVEGVRTVLAKHQGVKTEQIEVEHVLEYGPVLRIRFIVVDLEKPLKMFFEDELDDDGLNEGEVSGKSEVDSFVQKHGAKWCDLRATFGAKTGHVTAEIMTS